MLPSARLLELARHAFSHDWLNQVQRTLEPLPPLAPELRVAVFVLRRVCADVAGWMDAVQPIEAARHDAVEAVLAALLRAALGRLARFQALGWDELAALIGAAERVRVTL